MTNSRTTESNFGEEQNRDQLEFGMQTSRQGEKFREGKNPFTGEVVRFYDSTSTEEECNALEDFLTRCGILFNSDIIEYSGELCGTQIYLPNVDLSHRRFSGCRINLVGEMISDESLLAVLDMGKAAGAYYCTYGGPAAAPTNEIKSRAAEHVEDEIILVDTVEKLRNWLIDHVGVRRVI